MTEPPWKEGRKGVLDYARNGRCEPSKTPPVSGTSLSRSVAENEGNNVSKMGSLG